MIAQGAPEDLSADAALDAMRAAGAYLEGHFILSSGLRSSVYMQCARAMSDPALGARLCASLARRVLSDTLNAREAPTLCVSPAMGAVIVGYETARWLGLRSVFVERRKTDDVFELRRGFEIPPGAACLMIEDVVTTGKSSRECIAAIEAAGGRCVGAACLVDRSGGRADLGAPLTALVRIDAPVYEPDMLPPELAAIEPMKPGSRRDVGMRGAAS